MDAFCDASNEVCGADTAAFGRALKRRGLSAA